MVSRVVFCFDGDRAGRQAASRALETVMPQMIDGREARFLFLPEGDDPDDLVRREGAQAFKDRVTCAMPLSEFLFEQAAQGRDLNTVEGRERFASQVLSALSKVPEGMMRSLLFDELARRSGLKEAQLSALLTQQQARRPPAGSSSAAGNADDSEPAPSTRAPVSGSRSRRPGVLSTIERVIQLLLHEPTLVEEVSESLEWLPDDDQGALCKELITLLKAGRFRSPQVVLAHFQGSAEGQRLTTLAQQELLIPREARKAELLSIIDHLQQAQRKRSPEQEYALLINQERSGNKLDSEQRQRLAQLIKELAQR